MEALDYINKFESMLETYRIIFLTMRQTQEEVTTKLQLLVLLMKPMIIFTSPFIATADYGK